MNTGFIYDTESSLFFGRFNVSFEHTSKFFELFKITKVPINQKETENT